MDGTVLTLRIQMVIHVTVAEHSHAFAAPGTDADIAVDHLEYNELLYLDEVVSVVVDD